MVLVWYAVYSNSIISLAMINAVQNVAQESTVKQTNLARIFKALKGALARSTQCTMDFSLLPNNLNSVQKKLRSEKLAPLVM